MGDLIRIYINPKENLKQIKEKPLSYSSLISKFLLPFSFLPVLGYLIGFTVLKSNYLSSINQFIDLLKSDPKADLSTIEYMNKILLMLQSSDYSKIFIFLGIVWLFEIFKPIFLSALVFFFGKSFGGDNDPLKVFNLGVISLIPVWIAGLSYMVNSPVNAFLLFLASFYMFYLIFIGSEKILSIPSENSKNFQFIIVIVIFYVILSGIIGMFQTYLIRSLL
ncbi:YIP1 family protein [Sulfurihydrogenibium subterraneum]|uniref:YIP1 family protein n=1 Tax=Sulfurihydrogenibium subterraneum TaxID=171121 RepID=UPI00048CB0A3|nr:YIP1 family protein [Sulfurihydrogenibium subterraneum]